MRYTSYMTSAGCEVRFSYARIGWCVWLVSFSRGSGMEGSRRVFKQAFKTGQQEIIGRCAQFVAYLVLVNLPRIVSLGKSSGLSAVEQWVISPDEQTESYLRPYTSERYYLFLSSIACSCFGEFDDEEGSFGFRGSFNLP
jgi:hypothetical protein